MGATGVKLLKYNTSHKWSMGEEGPLFLCEDQANSGHKIKVEITFWLTLRLYHIKLYCFSVLTKQPAKQFSSAQGSHKGFLMFYNHPLIIVCLLPK